MGNGGKKGALGVSRGLDISSGDLDISVSGIPFRFVELDIYEAVHTLYN